METNLYTCKAFSDLLTTQRPSTEEHWLAKWGRLPSLPHEELLPAVKLLTQESQPGFALLTSRQATSKSALQLQVLATSTQFAPKSVASSLRFVALLFCCGILRQSIVELHGALVDRFGLTLQLQTSKKLMSCFPKRQG